MLPDSPSARCGNPWHGLAVRQPSGLGLLPSGTLIRMPGSGRTIYVKKPGLDVPVTTLDETAAGMEWRNDALITGSFGQLYQKDLGARSFLYFGHTDNWLVKLSTDSVSNLQAAGVLNFQIIKFGMFGGTPQTITQAVAMPTWGQNAPTIPVPEFGYTDITSANITLMDANRVGTAAIFMLENTTLDFQLSGGEVIDPIDRALGFLEATITEDTPGFPVVAVSVLATRDQTLGVPSVNRTSQLTLTPVGWPAGPDDNQWVGYGVKSGSETIEYAVSGRIVTMWYDTTTQLPVSIKGEAKATVVRTRSDEAVSWGEYHAIETYTRNLEFSLYDKDGIKRQTTWQTGTTTTNIIRLGFSAGAGPTCQMESTYTAETEHSGVIETNSTSSAVSACTTTANEFITLGQPLELENLDAPSPPFSAYPFSYESLVTPSPRNRLDFLTGFLVAKRVYPYRWTPTCVGLVELKYTTHPAVFIGCCGRSEYSDTLTAINDNITHGSDDPRTGEKVFASTVRVCYT